ncbi:MAG: efflux RND transporter permease subunit [Janthinobacterium lividum]
MSAGNGSALRRSLSISVIGGLLASEILTHCTTPAIYLLLDRIRLRGRLCTSPTAPLARAS